jgi:predicted benzoate:H+ symporter BenE
MSITNPSKPVVRQTHARTFGPQVLFGIAVAAAFAVLAGGVTALSSALVAPVASTLLLATAAAAALAGWLRGNQADAARLTYWDVAGGLTLVGIGAAALVDPEQLARLFDAPSRQD